jgi:hypothetical protein
MLSGAANMKNSDLPSLESEQLPEDLPPPLQALWWLRKGGFAVGSEWHRAHELCQLREGDHAYDIVHALVHWIEGDSGNAAYWYRRAGDSRAATIEQEWQRIVAKLLEG